ncbi:MAG: ABC transporter substrate-binding protein [Chloroflexota bacterium]|nr:ABC transporter substrate-binding protein [Chloroflexota bacterium]
MLNKRNWLFVLLSAIMVLAFLASCATPEPEIIEVEKTVEVEKIVEVEKTVEVEKVVEVEVTAAPTGPGVFAGAYPYSVPPIGHLNMFATNAVLGTTIYRPLFHPPMAYYKWADGSWDPLLAKDWEVDADAATLTVNLIEGAKWSNGDDFTAEDVWATFMCRRLSNGTVWRFLDSVEVADEHTVVFHMSDPSTVVERYVIRNEHIVDRATYGEWANKVQDLVAQGLDSDSDEWKTLLQKFNEYRPEELNAIGPYTIDMASINEARLTLTKNESSWLADTVNFDLVYIYNGETPTVTPIVLAQQVDYATHGFPPATEKAYQSAGIRILRPPTHFGPAIFFNQTIYPFDNPEVRRAIAYAIDKKENGIVSLGDSGKPTKYMNGIPDEMIPNWIDDTSGFESYAQDTAKATEILEGLGFARDDDGVWVTDTGERMEYELVAPAEFADWSAAAENAAEQLTEFGIVTTYRGVEFRQHPIEVSKGNFEMAIEGWGAGNPHPHFAFVEELFTYNIEAAEGSGMNFPMVQDTECCGEIDFEQKIEDMTIGLDNEAQKELVFTVAQAFNELLPVVPLWERYGNNPAMDGLHTCGWPADGDPIYDNNPYKDSFVLMMILDGTLYPCNQ